MEESTCASEIMTNATSSVAISGVDLISDLQDDLLLRILSLLPAASEVARTSVLSRRWRHLWPNATALRFTLGSKPETYTVADSDEARRLIAAASAVVEQRANNGPSVKNVNLDFIYDDNFFEMGQHYHAKAITSEHIAAWLLFAERHVTGKFKLLVPYHVDEEEEDGDGTEPEVEVDAEEAAAADEVVEPPVLELEHADDDNKEEKDLVANLPCSAKLQQLWLILGKARLTLPVARTGAFNALTEFFLSYARVDSAGGDDVRLGELLSSSCSPRLRRLWLFYVSGLATLSLSAANTLQELQLAWLYDLTSLHVAAPGLLKLGVWDCYRLSEARISAPGVQELQFVGHTKLLQFDGAASVRRIDWLEMSSHRRHVDDEDDCNNNSADMWLLRNCTGVDRLSLEVVMPFWWWSHITDNHSHDIQEGDIVDMMAEVPHLPNITDLTIGVNAYGHAIGASLAKIIAKCTNIENLFVYMDSTGSDECLDLSCICLHQSTDWDSQKISLKRLRSIEISYMELLDSQIRLVRLLLTSSTSLERMTVRLDTSHLEDGEEVDFDIPCYGGRWVPGVWEYSELGLFVRPVEYEWMQDMERVQGTGEA